MRHPQRGRDHDPAVAGQGAAGRRGRLGQGVRGDQPGQRPGPVDPVDAGADVPAAARVRPRLGRHRALSPGERGAAGGRGVVLRAARGEHPRHLHAVPGREPAAARRALRVDGVLGRDLRQLGARRADQLRGDRLHRRRLADREGPLLGQPPGREPARHAPDRRAGPEGRELPGLGDAGLLRGRGRGRGPPGDHRGHRPARPDRAQALRRGRGDLGRGRALPHSRDHARGADGGGGVQRRRRRCRRRWCTGRPSGGRCTRR